MAQVLAKNGAFLLRPINVLDLTGNPSVGQQEYAALLGLLNRMFNIGAELLGRDKLEPIFM